MKLSRTALALLTCSSALTVSACGEKHVVTALVPPADRMDCQAVTKEQRPKIPPEYVIDWSKVTTVPQAKSEHDAYVRTVRTREGVVAGYIVELEGKLFVCASDATWLRDFFKETAR